MAGEAQPGHAGLTPPRVLVATASIGAGHDLPAEVIAAELRDRGAHVTVADSLKVAGPMVERLVLGGAKFESRLGNLAFDAEHVLLARVPPVRWAAGWLAERLAGPGLRRLIGQERPDVIVSTYPGATEVLGRLRRRGRLAVPLVSAITDLASLRWWAHPGVDLHLVTHAEAEAEVRSIAGAGADVVCARGMNDPAWAEPLEPAEARCRLELPADPPLIAVSGGGWGIGDLEGAVEEALNRPRAIVVVLCGTNERARARLEQRFAGDRRVRVWGFTDRLPELFAAADALVHSTAGLTVLEALARGCPAISYGWGRGHIRANNRAYVRFGLAQVARDRGELGPALDRALAQRPEPEASFPRLPTAAALVLERFAGPARGERGADAR